MELFNPLPRRSRQHDHQLHMAVIQRMRFFHDGQISYRHLPLKNRYGKAVGHIAAFRKTETYNLAVHMVGKPRLGNFLSGDEGRITIGLQMQPFPMHFMPRAWIASTSA